MVKNTSILMVLNRRANLESTLGHVISFFKGEPVAVPRILVRDAVNMGAVPYDEKISVEEKLVEDKPAQPVDPFEREQDILEVLEVMVEENLRADFTASGTPKVTAVSKRVGYKVDGTEVTKAWNARTLEEDDA